MSASFVIRGQHRPGRWVFGAVERDSLNCALVEVANRNTATLEPIIQEWLLPGTRIMSDGWGAYGNLDNIGGGVYMHDVVVHQDNFVHPVHLDVHTNHVENIWMRARWKFKRGLTVTSRGNPAESMCDYFRFHCQA